MKKNKMLVDVMLVVVAIMIVVGSAIGFFFFELEATMFYIILGSTLAIALIVLYVRNYKDSSYGGKFNERYPDAK